MHQNNFDFLRLLFALLVIITHSYTLSGISDTHDILYQLTGTLTLSKFGVQGFFIISGFLIFESLRRSKSLIDYAFKRVVRIFPALAIVLIFSVLLGIFVYDGDMKSYFSERMVFTYIPNNLLLIFKLQRSINGIFEANPYPQIINGSLWTIPYEFFFYIVLALLYPIRTKKKQVLIVLSVSLIVLFLLKCFYPADEDFAIKPTILNFNSVVDFGLFFLSGSFLSLFKKRIYNRKSIIGSISLVLIILSIYLKTFYLCQYFLLPIVIVSIGIASTKGIYGLNQKIGDFSYGIYLYGFVIQQSLMFYFHLSFLSLMLITMPIAILFGFLSWNLIEKRALRLKSMSLNNRTLKFNKLVTVKESS